MMEVYSNAFINCEKDNWAKLLLIVEFAYNNAKYASTGYTPFELSYGYHSSISYEEDVDPRSRSKADNKLTKELRNLIVIYRENL